MHFFFYFESFTNLFLFNYCRQMDLNNYVSTIPTKNYSNFSINICLYWNKNNTNSKILNGILLISD